MDDPRTHEMLEALADLFLTGPTAEAHPPTGTTGPRPRTQPQIHSAPAGVEQNAPTGPLRLPPKLTILRPTAAAMPPAAQAAAPASAEGDPVIASIGARSGDRGAASDMTAAGTAPAARAVPLEVEGVLLGALPGFAHPWLTQYAHHLAQRRGPVLLLRWSANAVEMDWVGPRPQPAPERAVMTGAAGTMEPAPTNWTAPVEVLEHFLHDSAAPVRTILVHAESPETIMSLRPQRWTIVCGTYEAAVEDASRRMEHLASLYQGQAAAPGPAPAWRAGVMWMGGDAQRCILAQAQLNQALAGILAAPVEKRGERRQMQPVVTRALGKFPAEAGLAGDLRAYLEEWRATAEPVVEPMATPTEQACSMTMPQEVLTPSPLGPDITQIPAPQATPVAVPAPKVVATPAATATTVTATTTTPVATSATMAGPTAAGTDVLDWEALIAQTIPGAITLTARNKRHPQVPLYLDEEGRLHLAVVALSQAAGTVAAQDIPHAVMSLLEVRAWLREHFELIALTQRQCRFDPASAADPVLHLAADQAPLATALVNRLGAALQVHLLQHVRLGQASGWVCTTLSA